MARLKPAHPPAALKRSEGRPGGTRSVSRRSTSGGVSGTSSTLGDGAKRGGGGGVSRSRSATGDGMLGMITWGTKPGGSCAGGGGRRQGRATAAALTEEGVAGAAAAKAGAARRPRVANGRFQSSIFLFFLICCQVHAVLVTHTCTLTRHKKFQ
jgi:hypothetical protein